MLISEKSMYFCKHGDINLAHECIYMSHSTKMKEFVREKKAKK